MLQQVGVTVEGMDVDTETLMPATAQASQEAKGHQDMYDMSLAKFGPDHATTKHLKDTLEKHLQKAGNLAQVKNNKQLADARYQVTQHGENMDKDQQRIRELEDKHLA
eukprot:11523629-Karenia_brevis.AAC.1